MPRVYLFLQEEVNLEKYLTIVFPINTSKKLRVPIVENQRLITIFEELALEDKFFSDFLESEGKTDEGPIVMIYNRKHIKIHELATMCVKPGDELYFIPPILGG
jgi:molybdopterin converting factor small subunit